MSVRSLVRTNFEPNLQVPAGREADHVLQQSHIILFQPDFAKVVGHFENERAVILTADAQWSEPKVVGISAQHRAKMLLRRSPNFLSRWVHF